MAATRSATRPSKPRKATRPARPRIPEDFFTSEAHALLTQLLVSRAERWQGDSMPPMYFYRGDSEPLWGEAARVRCSGTTLRIARLGILCECLCMDMERGLRLLTLPWTAQNTTADSHQAEEWRIGQLFRELARRKGIEQALHTLRLAIDTLWC